MSADGPGRREVAHRLFAAEFEDADLSYSESDEERAPNYVVTPTGARVNRLFVVGVLTEVESVNEDVLRGRVVDPTGAFVTYAGQYQPDPMTFLERAEPPAFVALSGKARTFQPDDSDRVFTSVRPESVNAVDAATRDRWIVGAARATLYRVAVLAEALTMDERGDDLRVALESMGVREHVAAGVPVAIDHYGTGAAYLDAVRRLAVDALETVADERDAVRALEVAPDDSAGGDVGPIPASVAPDLDRDAATDATPTAGDSGATADDVGTAAGATETATDAAGTGEDATDERRPADADDPASAAADAADATDATDAASADERGDAATDPAEAVESTDTDGVDAPAGSASTAAAESAADASGTSSDTTDGAEAAGTPEQSASTSDGGLGDFDAGDGIEATDAGTVEGGDDADALDDAIGSGDDADALDDEAGMYELDEEERREVEDEFGTEFSTGDEVDDPGEADIDVPDADDLDVEAGAAPSDPAAEPSKPDDSETTSADEGDDVAADSDADVDLEDAVVAAMEELDDGDGAAREAVVASVVDDTGAAPDAVEDAVQDALMGGRCYEPSDGTLKAI